MIWAPEEEGILLEEQNEDDLVAHEGVVAREA